MRLASVKNWNNAATPLTATELAGEFLESTTLSAKFKDVGRTALKLFVTDPRSAKRLLNYSPSEFCDDLEYLEFAQFKALFLKSTAGGSQESRRNAAKAAFWAAEARCKRTNERLSFYDRHPDRENPIYRILLSRARSMISEVLGSFSEVTLKHVVDMSVPGGGSAIGTLDRRRVARPFKLGETKLAVTPRCLPYGRMLVEGSWPWLRLHAEVDWSTMTYSVPYDVTPSNRVSFVPKDATTDRTIAVEPALNVCLQLGVHSWLSRRLKSFGVRLDSQHRNQLLARRGAMESGTLDPVATLDLSSASDSMSYALVRRLLPSDWFGFLDDLRSPTFVMDGGTHNYQKWSSMGNGYTFALETLIFWALARACLTMTRCEQLVAVYGDDIVVPRSSALLLIELLAYAGFSVNREKTFVTGPFRESCGEDWFVSSRVVPVYLRELKNLCPTDLYKVINGLRRLGLHSKQVESLCLKAHRGQPILYGLPNGDETTDCIHCTDLSFLKKRGLVRWVPSLYAYEQRVASFLPSKRGVPQLWGLAAAILGDRNVTESWTHKALAPNRTVGRWAAVRRVRG